MSANEYLADLESELKSSKSTIENLHSELQKTKLALTSMEQRKDDAYLERNRLVAALTMFYPSGVAKTTIEGWSEDWHNCVYIDTPAGQMSWHFHDSQAHLFSHLPQYDDSWDGHTTEDKYNRLQILINGHAINNLRTPPLAELLDVLHVSFELSTAEEIKDACRIITDVQGFSSAHKDVLTVTVCGPVWDGDLPSKSGRNDLVRLGYVVQIVNDGKQGCNACTNKGYMAHKLVQYMKGKQNV